MYCLAWKTCVYSCNYKTCIVNVVFFVNVWQLGLVGVPFWLGSFWA